MSSPGPLTDEQLHSLAGDVQRGLADMTAAQSDLLNSLQVQLAYAGASVQANVATAVQSYQARLNALANQLGTETQAVIQAAQSLLDQRAAELLTAADEVGLESPLPPVPPDVSAGTSDTGVVTSCASCEDLASSTTCAVPYSCPPVSVHVTCAPSTSAIPSAVASTSAVTSTSASATNTPSVSQTCDGATLIQLCPPSDPSWLYGQGALSDWLQSDFAADYRNKLAAALPEVKQLLAGVNTFGDLVAMVNDDIAKALAQTVVEQERNKLVAE